MPIKSCQWVYKGVRVPRAPLFTTRPFLPTDALPTDAQGPAFPGSVPWVEFAPKRDRFSRPKSRGPQAVLKMKVFAKCGDFADRPFQHGFVSTRLS